jgi:hypothetical protein
MRFGEHISGSIARRLGGTKLASGGAVTMNMSVPDRWRRATLYRMPHG